MPYEFTQDAFRQFTADVIAANGDQATLTTILADMQDTAFNSMGQIESLNKDKNTLTQENERLRNANMELFLKIGDQAQKPQEDGKPKEKEPESTRDYMEKYFNKLEGK